jgi:hypothetical protein
MVVVRLLVQGNDVEPQGQQVLAKAIVDLARDPLALGLTAGALVGQ